MDLRIHNSMTIAGLLTTQALFGHEDAGVIGPADGLHLQGTLAATYRSMATMETSQRWIIPGFLMGGEALPMPRGFALDEIFLGGSYARESTYAVVKVGQHAGSDQASIEHAWVGQRLTEWAVVEAGRMNANFSPYNGLHPSQTPFADALLVYDALWGRQYNDIGARTQVRFGETGFETGLEYWQGGSFPSHRKSDGNGDGAFDVYLNFRQAGDAPKVRLGAFYYLGRAVSRKDDRYSSEHSHGLDTATIPEFFFDGTTKVYGIHGRFEGSSGAFRSGVEGEYQLSKSEGALRDAAHFSPFVADSIGFWGSLYQQFAEHQAAARYERLQFKNDLAGAGAAALTQVAMLAGTRDPYRLSVSYSFQASESLRWRAEWQRDCSTLRMIDRGILGLVWMQKGTGLEND